MNIIFSILAFISILWLSGTIAGAILLANFMEDKRK